LNAFWGSIVAAIGMASLVFTIPLGMVAIKEFKNMMELLKK
jgi:hypothetical protein